MSGRFRISRSLALALVSWAVILVAPEAAGQDEPEVPDVAFEPRAVVASGFAPEAEVIFFAVYRDPQGFHSRVGSFYGSAPADGLGEARFELPEPIPLKSVWAVAEVTSGWVLVTAPPGFSLREIPFPEEGVRLAAAGQVGALVHHGERLEVLVVRPRRGAWAGRIGDGTERDGDRRLDGLVRVEPDRLEALTQGPPPPSVLRPGDRVVAVDPRTLEHFVFEPEPPKRPKG